MAAVGEEGEANRDLVMRKGEMFRVRSVDGLIDNNSVNLQYNDSD